MSRDVHYFITAAGMGFLVTMVTLIGILALRIEQDARPALPDCANGAPEDVVIYRTEVPGPWNACAPADNL